MSSLGSRLRPEMPASLAPGAGGKRFRALDKATGSTLWQTELPPVRRRAHDLHVRGQAVSSWSRLGGLGARRRDSSRGVEPSLTSGLATPTSRAVWACQAGARTAHRSFAAAARRLENVSSFAERVTSVATLAVDASSITRLETRSSRGGLGQEVKREHRDAGRPAQDKVPAAPAAAHRVRQTRRSRQFATPETSGEPTS